MQIVIDRQALLTVLKRSAAAITPNDMVSVRQCVLIDAADGSALSFAATNGQIDIIVSARGEVKDPGRAALNHHRLSSLINELPDGFVEMTVDAKFRVSIRSSSSKRKFTMTALDPVDFPPVLALEAPPTLYSVEAKILLQAAGEVSFAIDSKASQLPAGALLSPVEDKFFEIAAVDGHVFAMAKGWFTERGSAEDCLLPKNFLDALRGVPKDHVIALAQGDNKIFATAPDMRVRCNQIQQPFPVGLKRGMLQSVPAERRFRVSSQALLESVSAVSTASEFVEGKDKYVQIDLTCTAGVVTLATRKSESASGEDELTVSDSDLSSFKLHFNATLMSLALKSFSPVEIDFYYAIIADRPMAFLKSETLIASVMLIDEIPSPPARSK